MALICAGHHYGWPVARGGSRAITDALVAVAARARGHRRDRQAGALSLPTPRADAVVLDLAPAGVADVAGDRLPARVLRAYGRYRQGPAAFKLDLAVEGGVPWTDEACRRAGTVHVAARRGGRGRRARDQRGRMPERPFVLVGQQYLADPGRSAGDVHPVWAYAHVPSGYDGDARAAIIAQIERFAPGLRERRGPARCARRAQFAADDANDIGGDIITGANTPLQLANAPHVTPSRTARHPGRVHLLRRHPTGRGRARHERL